MHSTKDHYMCYSLKEEPKAKEEYIKKLDKIRKGNFLQVNDFVSSYGL